MDNLQLLAASREEARQLGNQPVSEIAPSRRDFAMFVSTQKQELAVIARLAGQPARAATTVQLIAHARACDDADVAALAVAAGIDELSMADLAAIAEATTAPILRDYPLIDTNQLYHSRLHGADAVLLPAEALDRDRLHELVVAASSLHMACVVEVSSAAGIERAVHLPHVIIGLHCTHADGTLDLARTRQLAEEAPRQGTVLALPEIRSATECASLRGVCDAVLLGETLWQGTDVAARLREINAG
jgi:indole-3-glycerol phosphate synthase